MLQVVFDTNILVAAIRSRTGASHRLILELAGPRLWILNLSNALATEYVEVIHREGAKLGHAPAALDTFLNFVCHAAIEREIFFRWRPFLADPDDEMVLELAVACAASHLITFNKRDFAGAERFGINVLTPGEFLAVLRS